MDCFSGCKRSLFSLCCLNKNKNKHTLLWTTDDDNALIQYITSGYTLDGIVKIMDKPIGFIEYRIIDNMSKHSNYEVVYHMGPGVKYCNYINFIKKKYEYESL